MLHERTHGSILLNCFASDILQKYYPNISPDLSYMQIDYEKKIVPKVRKIWINKMDL